MAYITKERNVFLLTEIEILYDRISYKRVLEFINRRDVHVIDFRRDSNSYGEFRFITLRCGEEAICVFGHGLHEYRDHYLNEEWSFYTHPANRDAAPMLRNPVLSELEEEHKKYLADEAAHGAQSEEGQLFSFFADLSDDDGAISDLEDFGLL